ncbi:DUF6333 family protein [Streptomyces sp. N2A]|uniref:DUF6333 family protein n=1 Tax=Streptomyces sp. N2A TaxID=3073936 RepID=UPI0037DA6C84
MICSCAGAPRVGPVRTRGTWGGRGLHPHLRPAPFPDPAAEFAAHDPSRAREFAKASGTVDEVLDEALDEVRSASASASAAEPMALAGMSSSRTINGPRYSDREADPGVGRAAPEIGALITPP